MPNRSYRWTGYKDSVSRDMLEPDRLAVGSRNVFIDPNDGAWRRRGGSLIFADTLGGGGQVGLFEKKVGLKGRHAVEWGSPSLADGYPTLALLATNESTGEGAVGFRSTNGGAGPDGLPGTFHTLGDDFGSAHYPFDSVTSKAELICIPLKQRHAPASAVNTRRFNRLIDSQQRITTAAGARRLMQMAGQGFCPAFDGTPWRTNKAFNDSNSSGTNIERVMPWGHIPPMGDLSVAFSQSASSGSVNWTSGASFFYTYAFIMDDGSITMPMEPRPASTLLPSGLNLFTVPSPGGGVIGYQVATISNIQRGPKGCVGRLLLRSPTVSSGVPSPSDLRIVATIQNNTVTSYVETLGSNADADLESNPVLVRTDHMWPWRARYGFKCDERLFLGYLRPTAASLIIGPWKSAAGTVINLLDEDSPSGASGAPHGIAVVEVQSAGPTTVNQLWLYQTSGLKSVYDFATYTTLRDLIDAINADTDTTGGHWRCQAAPGADLSLPTANLELTQLTISTTVTSGSPTIQVRLSNNFFDVVPGMIVSGSGIPAGSRVVSVAANGTSLVINQNASGNSSSTCTFAWDVGDNAGGFSVDGIFRTDSCAYPAVAYLKESAVDSFGLFKQRLMFTSAEPGHARNAPQSFYVGNRLQGSDDWGIFQGGGEVNNGVVRAVACFSKAIAIITNPKANSTGLDADYRLLLLNPRRGCIAWDSIVVGDGWVAYLTSDGYVATDGIWERMLSSDVYNVSRATGQLSYEVGQCRAAASGDADNAQAHAVIGEGVIYLAFRSSGSVTTPDSMLRYDFGSTVASNGLPQVMKQAQISHYGQGAVYEGDLLGVAYGWSAPYNADASTSFRPGTMGVVRNGSGLLLFFCDDRNQGSTGDGRLEQFETAALSDDSVAYGSHGWTPTDRFDTNDKKTLDSLTAIYNKGVGAFQIDGVRDISRSNVVRAMNFPNAASAVAAIGYRYYRGAPLALRTDTDTIQFHFYWTDGANLNQFTMFGIDANANVVPSFN